MAGCPPHGHHEPGKHLRNGSCHDVHPLAYFLAKPVQTMGGKLTTDRSHSLLTLHNPFRHLAVQERWDSPFLSLPAISLVSAGESLPGSGRMSSCLPIAMISVERCCHGWSSCHPLL